MLFELSNKIPKNGQNGIPYQEFLEKYLLVTFAVIICQCRGGNASRFVLYE